MKYGCTMKKKNTTTKMMKPKGTKPMSKSYGSKKK